MESFYHYGQREHLARKLQAHLTHTRSLSEITSGPSLWVIDLSTNLKEDAARASRDLVNFITWIIIPLTD